MTEHDGTDGGSRHVLDAGDECAGADVPMYAAKHSGRDESAGAGGRR